MKKPLFQALITSVRFHKLQIMSDRNRAQYIWRSHIYAHLWFTNQRPENPESLKSLNLISQLRALYRSGFSFHPEPGYYYTVLQQSSLNKCNLSIVIFFLVIIVVL